MEKYVRLREILDQTLQEFVQSGQQKSDAIEPALAFTDWHDREFAAFLCAVIAYGRVEHIKKSIHKVLDPMGPSPHKWLLRADRSAIRALVNGWAHRFNTSRDMDVFLRLLQAIYRKHGSLEKFWMNGGAIPVFDLIERFHERLKVLAEEESIGLPPSISSFWFLLPKSSAGSACKRINLFLRWVAGRGPMDLALWSSLPRKNLLIPLDVHVLRQARALKMTKRKQADWRTVEEVTAALRHMDPEDPTRFDFALCHLGINGTVLRPKDLKPVRSP